ncbi:bacterio-opsin activator domain-containing protein [Natrialbaceae archaeon A-gly3]
MSHTDAQGERSIEEGFYALLIEDNPGDARLIQEMLKGSGELDHRVGPGSTDGDGDLAVKRETRLEDGLSHLESEPVDVVLLDLNLPDSEGLDSLRQTLETVEWTPVVVLTGLTDRDVGVRAIEEGAQDYLVKGEVTDELLTRSIHHAIERNRQELERERKREQLESLNRLNEISQDVTHDVITTSTRDQLERDVCERLAEEDAYLFAWIGELERGGTEVIPKASAGVDEGYLEEITITADEQPTGQGPSGRAIKTKTVQIASDIETDPKYEPWRDRARERGYRSSASVPIVHDDLLYGILNVYSASPNAFTHAERTVLSGLGDVVGHAIAALERKNALTSDSVRELEFRVDDLAESVVDLVTEQDGRIQFERLLQREDTLFAYGTATDLPRDDLEETIAALEWIEEVRLLTGGYDEFELEVRTAESVDLVDTLAAHGGKVANVVVTDDELRFVAEIPHGADTRRVIDVIGETCPGSDFLAQRTRSRSEDELLDYRSVLEDLTEKQREALEIAVYAGYFDWPRASTGEEVAERLGVSAATFTQHLRAAERQFFDAVFDRNTDD